MLLEKTDMRHWVSENQGAGEERFGPQADDERHLGLTSTRFPWGAGRLWIRPQVLFKDRTLGRSGAEERSRPVSDEGEVGTIFWVTLN